MNGIYKIIAFLIILQIVLFSEITAQEIFKPAYIIDLKGDTIYGEVDYRGDLYMGKECIFQKNGKITEFKPDQIKGYRFIDGKYFVSREIENKKYFLEFLIKAKVNIYYYRNLSGDHYYIENDTSKLVEIPIDEEYKKIRGKLYVNKNKKHIGILKYFMQDAKDFDKRIASIKNVDHKELIYLARDYHNQVCKDQECVIYTKPPDIIRVKIEPIFGLGYINNDEISSKLLVQYGIQSNIWIPRINENLYFRTGFLVSPIGYDDNSISYYKIPLAIEYESPHPKIKWKMGYGINIYKYFYVTVDLKLGMAIPLSNKMDINISNNVEFHQLKYFIFLPEKFLANWVNIGLAYKFSYKNKG